MLKQDRRANTGRERYDPCLPQFLELPTPMNPRRDGAASLIDYLVREGARRMLANALQAEVDDYIARHIGERSENGHRR